MRAKQSVACIKNQSKVSTINPFTEKGLEFFRNIMVPRSYTIKYTDSLDTLNTSWYTYCKRKKNNVLTPTKDL